MPNLLEWISLALDLVAFVAVGVAFYQVRRTRRAYADLARIRAMRGELVDELEQAGHPPTDPDGMPRYLA